MDLRKFAISMPNLSQSRAALFLEFLSAQDRTVVKQDKLSLVDHFHNYINVGY